MDNDIDSKRVWGIFRFPFVTHFISVSLRKSRSRFDFFVWNAIIPLIRDICNVDFGNSEVVPLSAIRQEMPFMEIPQQCLQLVLRGIEPVSLQIPFQPPPPPQLVLFVIFWFNILLMCFCWMYRLINKSHFNVSFEASLSNGSNLIGFRYHKSPVAHW